MAIKIDKFMILPYFDYGDVDTWEGNKYMLDKLQRLQSRALAHIPPDCCCQTVNFTSFDKTACVVVLAGFVIITLRSLQSA